MAHTTPHIYLHIPDVMNEETVLETNHQATPIHSDCLQIGGVIDPDPVLMTRI